MDRPNALPRSPFNKNAGLELDSTEIYRGWPPRGTGTSNRSHSFLSNRPDKGLKVVWPPNWGTNSTEVDFESGDVYPQEIHSGQFQNQNGHQNAGGPNMTMTYPSAFKLRDEAPIDHQTLPLSAPSQPAFKLTTPIKKKGDEVWPPKDAFLDEPSSDVREFSRPTKSNKTYDSFFAGNMIPNNYPGYRAPPGTQHVGYMDDAQPL